jgi:hypothetical protein
MEENFLRYFGLSKLPNITMGLLGCFYDAKVAWGLALWFIATSCVITEETASIVRVLRIQILVVKA